MAWNYRRRIKIIPGVHLNFSKSGISTSIGIKGASITIGKSGTYLNQSIPVLGIYNRQKLFSNIEENNQIPISEKNIDELPKFENNISSANNNISSANVEEVTSQDMQGIKDSIISAHRERIELHKNLQEVKNALSNSEKKLRSIITVLYGIFKKSVPSKIKEDISLQNEIIEDLENQIANCFVNLEIEFDLEIEQKYTKLLNCFINLSKSQKIWDVTNASFEDTRITRSSAGTVVNKVEVKFSTKTLPEIKSKYDALYMKNANGADLYIYPYFMIMYSNQTNFAIVGLDEINLNHSYVRFTETANVPSDSKIIDTTWLKVNKDGSPDRRFNGNRQVPVVKYGEITIKTDLGINEEYEFSNYEFTEEFGKAFKEYQNTIKSLRNLNSDVKLEVKTEKTINSEIEITTNPLINLPELNSENNSEIENIYNTEASIITENSKEVGKITKLSGQFGQSEIHLYLALEDWQKFPINLIPTLSIEFKVTKETNILIVCSTNKEITPLKKGDVFSIIFEDESFLEKKFLGGRIQSGKNVKNLMILSDLELISLTQNFVKRIETFSGLKMPYEFTKLENKQYPNPTDGKRLFKIMSERITGIKLLLRNSN